MTAMTGVASILFNWIMVILEAHSAARRLPQMPRVALHVTGGVFEDVIAMFPHAQVIVTQIIEARGFRVRAPCQRGM
jgi:hypothetical protein